MPQAPFDFIELNDKIAPPEAVIVQALEMGELLSNPLPEGHCGSLTVTWEFDGPFLTAGNLKPPENERPELPVLS